MNQTTFLIIQALVKYGPEVYAEVKKLLAKKEDPTESEWNLLESKVSKSYEDYTKAK